MHSQRKGVLAAAAGAVSVVMACAFAIFASHGLPQRFDRTSLEFASAKDHIVFDHSLSTEQVKAGQIPVCGVIGSPRKCLVWGDSHAMSLMPGIDAACKVHDVMCFQATHSATAPVLDFFYTDPYGLGERAPEFNRAVVDFAIARKVDVVILAGHWARCASDPSFEKSLRNTTQILTGAGIRVAIVRDTARFQGVPSFPYPVDVPALLSLATHRGWDVHKIGIPLEEYRSQAKPGDRVLSHITASNKIVRVLDATPYFVDPAGLWRAEFEGKAMFRDYHHLSIDGSLRTKPLFEELFDSLASERAQEPRRLPKRRT